MEPHLTRVWGKEPPRIVTLRGAKRGSAGVPVIRVGTDRATYHTHLILDRIRGPALSFVRSSTGVVTYSNQIVKAQCSLKNLNLIQFNPRRGNETPRILWTHTPNSQYVRNLDLCCSRQCFARFGALTQCSHVCVWNDGKTFILELSNIPGRVLQNRSRIAPKRSKSDPER